MTARRLKAARALSIVGAGDGVRSARITGQNHCLDRAVADLENEQLSASETRAAKFEEALQARERSPKKLLPKRFKPFAALKVSIAKTE